jgi:ribosome-binding protein aMBF1 (putative translation factor)
MKLSKALQKFTDLAKTKDSYWVERAKLDFSMALEAQRLSVGMSYSSIAKKIGTSAAYITKVFRGDANMTIESMVKLARATGGKVRIQIVDEHANSKRWVDTITARSLDAANHPFFRTGTVVSLNKYSEDKIAA